MTRRILTTLAVTLLLAVTTHAQSDYDFQVVPVADGITAFIAKESKSGVVQGNVVLIAGDNGAIVIDTGQFPPQARKMVAEIRKLTTQPVRALLLTHWHGDHLLAGHRRDWTAFTRIAEAFKCFPGPHRWIVFGRRHVIALLQVGHKLAGCE